MVRQTSARLHVGERTLVSRTRTRQIDERIGGILLGAYQQLRRQLRHITSKHGWMSERGQELMRELRGTLDHRTVQGACLSRRPIRYTPINESYRPAVELSLGILGGRPFMSSAEGS